MSFSTVRGITEDPDFYRQMRQMIPDPYLLDSVLQGIYWQLARLPTSGVHIAHGIWAIACNPPPLGKRIAIYYSFDQQRVTLHMALRRIDI